MFDPFLPTKLITSLIGRVRRARLNFDEAKVPGYTLPDPLGIQYGSPISDSKDWIAERRPQILRLFEDHVYGRTPRTEDPISFVETRYEASVLGGTASRREVILRLIRGAGKVDIHLLIYIPQHALRPVPAFLALNFRGNHTIHLDPGITIRSQWQKKGPGSSPSQLVPSEKTRGIDSYRWPLEEILGRGFAVATAYYGDLEPDFPGGWRFGVRSIVGCPMGEFKKVSMNHPAAFFRIRSRVAPPWALADAWGAIGAWSWGMSRIMDYLERSSDINPLQVVLLGHSRLGKAALWSGAQDERFAIVISNNSGCGGAALSRRRCGETVEILNQVNPHWFCANFREYNGKEDELPVDQHMLIGLIAPRPVYIASASEDRGADPRGEFLAAKHADPIYGLFGRKGVGVDEMPFLDKPVGKYLGYHVRSGAHDLTGFDWAKYMDFAALHLNREVSIVR
jgi:hypothetical protein